MSERRIPGYCALCRSRCGAVAVVAGDRLLRVEPDPAHPTGTALCVKGRAGPEILANPNRVLYPLKRTNPSCLSQQCSTWNNRVTCLLRLQPTTEQKFLVEAS